MYEVFRNQVVSALVSNFSNEQIRLITSALDHVASCYNIEKQCTELAIDGRSEFIEIVKTFFAVRFTEGMSKTSIKTEQSIMKNFVLAMNVPINKIQPNHIRSYLFNYQQNHNISQRTLELYRTVICGFFRWAASESYIERDITMNIKPIKFVPNQRKALSQL